MSIYFDKSFKLWYNIDRYNNTLRSKNMDIASVCILVFFLIFSITGFCKGFIGIVLNVCKGIASMIVSYFLAKPVGEMIFNMGLGNKLIDKIEVAISSAVTSTDVIITAENYQTVVSNSLNELNIPEFLHNIIQKLVFNDVKEAAGNTLGYYISSALASLACAIIAFLILMIIINVSFFILRKMFKGINRIPIIGLVNRLCGLVLNFLFGWLILSVGFWGLSFLSTVVPEVNEFTNEFFSFTSGDMTIARWFYENNLVTKLYQLFIK